MINCLFCFHTFNTSVDNSCWFIFAAAAASYSICLLLTFHKCVSDYLTSSLLGLLTTRSSLEMEMEMEWSERAISLHALNNRLIWWTSKIGNLLCNFFSLSPSLSCTATTSVYQYNNHRNEIVSFIQNRFFAFDLLNVLLLFVFYSAGI